MRFEDLQSEGHYEAMEAYCRSKLANVLFTRELARRLGMRLVRPFEISPKRGAKTSLHLATSPAVAGRTGEYWVRSKRGHMSRQARNDEAAVRLWDESERLLAGAGFGVA
jgi:NAD(P)-dependent dehydrogenase (short-subunit alcohol dehydrogenase family)